MKKKHLKKHLRTLFNLPSIITILIVAILFSSCKKNISDNAVGTFVKPTKFANKVELYKYLNEQLKTYGIVFTALAKDSRIKDLVHEEVSKKFDGDDNVLIKTLFEKASGKGIDLKGMTKEILSKNGINITVDQLLGSLNDVQGISIYPQIYIPSFENFVVPQDKLASREPNKSVGFTNGSADLKDKTLAVIPPPQGYDNPVIVNYDGDESVEPLYYYGYTTQNDGTFINNIRISESYAENNEIWVITPNETTFQDETTGVIPTTFPGHSATQVVYVTHMTVKDAKESWIKGRSEIRMTYVQSWADGLNPTTGQYEYNIWLSKWYTADAYGPVTNGSNWVTMGNFSKVDVKRRLQREINCPMAVFGTPTTHVTNVYEWNYTRNWYPSKGDYIYFVIFEQDIWALYNETIPVHTTSTGRTVPVEVFSNNSPYIKQGIEIVPYNYVYGGLNNGLTSVAHYDNDGIELFISNRP